MKLTLSQIQDINEYPDQDQLEFIQKNNIDISALIKEENDKLIIEESK